MINRSNRSEVTAIRGQWSRPFMPYFDETMAVFGVANLYGKKHAVETRYVSAKFV
jgi:hypothetical protein